MNLQLPLSFYSSLLIVIEAVFISEQITECRIGKDKDLIWHMVGEMAKKQCRARLYVSYNHSGTLYILVDILLIKLKNVLTSACLKLNHGTAKQKQKNIKVAKMVEFIKTCEQYLLKFNFGNFFNSILLSPFCWGKIDLQKTLFERHG